MTGIVVGWLLACKGDDDGPVVTDTGDAPAALIATATVSIPSASAPLVRSLHVEAEVPVTASARWVSDDQEVAVAFDDLAAVQDHLLLGWRAGRTYTLTVTLTAGDGRTAIVPLEVATDPLPAHFPVGTVRRVAGVRQPGHTLIPMRAGQGPFPRELAVVFDEDGEICFWLDVQDVMLDVFEADDGLLVLLGDLPGYIVDYGWDGIERGRYTLGSGSLPSTVVNAAFARSFHHDVIRVDAGHYVALGKYPLPVPDYPADYDDPLPTAARMVTDDVIVDFRSDGTVTNELRMSEVLSVHRIGYDSLGTTVDGWADWAHTNAVLWDDGDYVVSVRHQDAIVKLDPAGTVRWILGYPENWPSALAAKRLQPVGDVQWPYHPHAPRFGPDGPNGERTLVLFDNGNHQAAPWTGIPPVTDPDLLQSRVVQFTIDEEAGTVRQDWAFDAPAGGRLYSEAVGDATVMPNGHVLSVWGLLDRLPDGTPNTVAGVGENSVRVIELDRDSVSEVEELYLWNEVSVNPRGWTGYRASRIPSLYGRVSD